MRGFDSCPVFQSSLLNPAREFDAREMGTGAAKLLEVQDWSGSVYKYPPI